MKNSSVVSVIATTVSAGGAFGGYMYFKPKDLKGYLQWKGQQLAEEKDAALWKAIYEDNKDTFDSDFGNVKEDDTNKWKVIRDYCLRVLKKQDYSDIEKAIKWCLDEVKTVRGQLVREEKDLSKLMTQKSEYQVATAVQGNPDFWALLGVPSGTFDEKTEAYQKWCTESLNEKPTKGLVGNVATFCAKKDYSNFEGRLKADNLVKIEEKDIDGKFESSFKDFKRKSKSSVLKFILGEEDKWFEIFSSKGENSRIDKSKFKVAYQKYCKEQDIKTFENNNYETLYPKYKVICAKPNTSKS